MADHIHTPGDGRGLRDVFVNGNKVHCAGWADTRAGVVWFFPYPFRLVKGKGVIYARRLRGVVEVRPRG